MSRISNYTKASATIGKEVPHPPLQHQQQQQNPPHSSSSSSSSSSMPNLSAMLLMNSLTSSTEHQQQHPHSSSSSTSSSSSSSMPNLNLMLLLKSLIISSTNHQQHQYRHQPDNKSNTPIVLHAHSHQQHKKKPQKPQFLLDPHHHHHASHSPVPSDSSINKHELDTHSMMNLKLMIGSPLISNFSSSCWICRFLLVVACIHLLHPSIEDCLKSSYCNVISHEYASTSTLPIYSCQLPQLSIDIFLQRLSGYFEGRF